MNPVTNLAIQLAFLQPNVPVPFFTGCIMIAVTLTVVAASAVFLWWCTKK